MTRNVLGSLALVLSVAACSKATPAEGPASVTPQPPVTALAQRGEPAAADQPVAKPTAASAASASEPVPASSAASPSTAAGACNNDDQSLVGPCPDLRQVSCNAAEYPAGCAGEMLSQAFRPRARGAYRKCIAHLPNNDNTNACFDAYQACVREAIDATCIDDEARRDCETVMKTCKKRNGKARFTEEQCGHLVAALGEPFRADTLKAISRDSCTRNGILPNFPATPFYRD